MHTTSLNKFCLNLVLALALPVTLLAQQDAPAAKPNPNQESHVGNLTGHAHAGAELYYRYCWGCHGARGNGEGENAQWIDPQPRNFVAAVFKCRSTPSGTLPTDEDLNNAISRGFITSTMPSWITLTAQNRADLVAFIKTFSARWTTDKAGQPIPVPAEAKLTLDSIRHGKELYQKLECFKCHGAEGRGDGPSASTLTDSQDHPIKPYNFNSGYRFKCGATNQDLFKIFMTGLDGTPMPSFADVVKPEDAWDLVHYLRTLQIWNKSPELALWQSQGGEYAKSNKPENTYTGADVHP
ncbi:MAG TPA: cytochrome c [Dongiaceae bacterium]|nr:cytochrome c [Dongiaceae bacterium]